MFWEWEDKIWDGSTAQEKIVVRSYSNKPGSAHQTYPTIHLYVKLIQSVLIES